MLIREPLTLNNTNFIKTYSSVGNYISREDGEKYTEAIDLEFVEHIYTETDEPIEDYEELEVQDALDMLNEFGVDTND